MKKTAFFIFFFIFIFIIFIIFIFFFFMGHGGRYRALTSSYLGEPSPSREEDLLQNVT